MTTQPDGGWSASEGLVAALLSLAFGYLGDIWGLPTVMFWILTVPYALNALYWFLFYRVYPQEVAAQQAREAAQGSTQGAA